MQSLFCTFNLPVAVLVVAGIFILVTRYAHVSNLPLPTISQLDPKDIIEELIKRFQNIAITDLFPTFGQVIAATSWIIAFMIVLMPALAKFLPFSSHQFLSQALSQGELTKKYLREFIPPREENTKYPLRTDDDINAVAKKFACNSFWPSGDERARLILYFAFFVLFIILLPLKFNFKTLGGIFTLALLIFLSVFLTNGLLWLFRFALGHVDRRLVDC